MRRLAGTIALLTALALPAVAAGSASQALGSDVQEFADPVADATGSAPETSEVTVALGDDGALRIDAVVENRAVLGDGDLYLVTIDADRDAATGSAGFEYMVVFDGESGGIDFLRWNGDSWALLADGAGGTWNRGPHVSLDLARIGSPAEIGLQLAGVSLTTGGFDAAPDSGTYLWKRATQGTSDPGDGGSGSGGGAAGGSGDGNAAGCESGGCAPGQDTLAPAVRPLARALALDARGRILLRIRCPASEVACRGHLALRTIRRYPLEAPESRRRRVFLGERPFAARGGTTRIVRMRLTTAGRRLIRRGAPITAELTIIAGDVANNVGVARWYLRVASTRPD